MNQNIPQGRRLLMAVTTFAYFSSVLMPAYASDTEVYTRKNTTTTLSPTIMFMLDTSGSMHNCMNNDSPVGCIGGLRKDALISSMSDALNGDGAIPGFVNVGLATYKHQIGDDEDDVAHMRYPARPLNALVNLAPNGVMRVRVMSGESDAEQVGGGSQDLVRNELSIGFKMGVAQSVGLRFTGILVPLGAEIRSAKIRFVAKASDDSEPIIWKLEAAASDDAPAFSAVSVNGRAYIPGSNLHRPGRWLVGGAYELDVKARVQDVVNRPGWCGGQALSFRIQDVTGNGAPRRRVYSYEGALAAGNIDLAPKLEISYLMGDEYFASPPKPSCIKVPPNTTTEVTDLRALTTVREQLTEAVNTLTFSGQTPLALAYLESARSMMGKPKSLSAIADPGTLDANGEYNTTVVANETCAGNYIFALTDGQPTGGAPTAQDTSTFGTGACTTPAGVTLGDQGIEHFSCMAGVARQLADGSDISAKVNTSTVILGPLAGQAETSMSGIAEAGRGEFYAARTPSDMADAIKSTIDALLNVSGSVTASGVAVNQLNRVSHLDQLYYSVFKPRLGDARWKGNIKRYKLDLAQGRVEDINGNAAIDPKTTFFKDTARSYWLHPAAKPDGKNAALGGAAKVLPAPDTRDGVGTERNMYSYYAAYPAIPASVSGQSLTKVAFGDASLKTAMGVTNNTVFTNLTAWLLGYAVNSISANITYNASSQLRYDMGGGLHSGPTLVNYGYNGTLPEASANANLQDNTVYFSTMDGVLHAINAKDGKEVFSFVPKEILPLIQRLYLNRSQALPEFGLDSSWTVYRKDGDGDFRISPNGAGGDKVIVYGGMRMGGSHYYALDVTNRDAPKLLFSLAPSTNGKFSQMGQTWSKPVISAVKINGVAKTVMVFGGGYDVKHETEGYTPGFSNSDAKGNQLYIVDAFTGELYWWASDSGNRPASGKVSDMKFSIASAVKPVDVNVDGYVDAFYVGDLGGQLFRLDVDNANTGQNTLIKRVKLFAKLAQANTTNQRRIFEPPSVASLFDIDTQKPYIAVAVGTGYRSHPLNDDTIDMFYMLRDNDLLRTDLLSSAPTPALQSVITGPSNVSGFEAQLAKLDISSAEGIVSGILNGKAGWYFPLEQAGESGEKVLDSPLIFGGEVYFNTYLPGAADDNCSPAVGSTRLYRMSAKDGAVLSDNNNDGTLTVDDRFEDNVVAGLGGPPQLIIGDVVDTVGGRTDCDGLPCKCDGKIAAPTDLVSVAIVVGTSVGKKEIFCRSGLKKTRWYELK